MTSIRIGALAGASAFALFAAASAHAQVKYVTPHTTTAAGAESVTLNGQTFTNQGLVGAGRLSASVKDFRGESIGSFSSMAIDLKSWRRTGGGYSGKLFTLPDRGPNNIAGLSTPDGTTDYHDRVHTFDFTLSPSSSGAVLPQSPASQNQLSLNPTGGFLLKDSTGADFTGRDPLGGTVVRNGITYPQSTDPALAGRLSMDPEAITFLADGSFYVGDEYAAGLYYFDPTGKQIGAIQAPEALLPRSAAGAVNFRGDVAPTTGRRNNQGLEAASVTPDGKKLVTILQSATIQDNGTGNQGRSNTRILVYDISTSRTPAKPVEHYVLQLPVINSAGVGAAPNATAAQSEMLALNTNQFLVLSRDGVGRGSGANAANSPVFKSVLLVDTTGATNIAGTPYETGTTPVSPGGVLNPAIKPVSQVELVNMLNPVQLNRFGMNLNTAPSTITSLSEKWEAMGLAPVLEEGAPQDFFLLIGNDNDFITSKGHVEGTDYDAGLTGPGGSGDNDSVILVYRLTLPTYVDPQALAALISTTPWAMAAAGESAASLGVGTLGASWSQLASTRRASLFGLAPFGQGVQVWAQGGGGRIERDSAATSLDADGWTGAAGVDFGSETFRFGGSINTQSLKSDSTAPFATEAKSVGFSVYAGTALADGFYAFAGIGYAPDVKLDRIDRPAAYGLTASGRTKGDAKAFSFEAGFTPQLGAVRAGPFAAVQSVAVNLDGYTEHGASLGNAAIPDNSFIRTEASFGLDLAGRIGPVIPSLRVGYALQNGGDNKLALVRLASAQHPMASQTVSIPSFNDDHWLADVGLDGVVGGLSWRISAQGRFTDGRSDLAGSVGVSRRF